MMVSDALDQVARVVVLGAGVLVVFAVVVYLVVPAIWRRWWYRDNRLAGKLQLKRRFLSEHFGLTIGRVHRDGRIRIAPGETPRWERDSLADELATALGQPVRISIDAGYARVRPVRRIGEVVEGEPSYDSATGRVIIGVDVETGEEAGFSLREISAVLLGARPGAGKTVLLQQVRDALTPHADVYVAAGKSPSDVEDAVEAIETIRKEMICRFEQKLDFWSDLQGLRLQVLILDECHRIFESASESKADKAAAKGRVCMVRDLVQRGRSAGVVTILATQRPSSDVIPTSIRDLATVRICGRVTGDDSKLVLGRLPEPGDPDPARLQPRRVVVDGGDGVWREEHVFERHG